MPSCIRVQNSKTLHNIYEMKAKIVRTVLPPIVGIVTVLVFLIAVNLILYNGGGFSTSDNGFFTLFVPITTIIAMAIQLTLTLNFWNRFKKDEKVWGMTLFQFTALLSIISGMIFGLVFWETSLGINELLLVTLVGIVAFALYWTANLFTMKQLDRF